MTESTLSPAGHDAYAVWRRQWEPPKPPPPQQRAPLVFEGEGWLALMRDGKPVALARAKPFMPNPNNVAIDDLEAAVRGWTDRDYWRPIDEKTLGLYRLSLPVLD